MIEYERTNLNGVPDYTAVEFEGRRHDYCLLIPVINEGARILTELGRAQKAGIDQLCDIVICDGGSTDGSMKRETLALYHVNTLLTKTGPGRQGAQLRMGMYFALDRNYKGVLTIDGNNKDSIEDVPEFIAKLQEGYDLVQGSRFIRGGHAINTPPVRYAAVRLIHAPLVSLGAHQWFTDTTNAYRAYSREYLTHPDVRPLRDVFGGYELLAYLSIRATQLGLKACEVPVTRAYPATGKTPTKIDRAVRYRARSAVCHRSCKWAVSYRHQLYDIAGGFPPDLHHQRNLAGRRLVLHYVHSRAFQRQPGAERSRHAGRREPDSANTNR